MSDLIWIGNTLYPRWLVFTLIAIIVLVPIVTFVILTDDKK